MGLLQSNCDLFDRNSHMQVDPAAQQAIEQELINAAHEPLPDDGDDDLLND